jgi:hypothetical protein
VNGEVRLLVTGEVETIDADAAGDRLLEDRRRDDLSTPLDFARSANADRTKPRRL